jgi:hypothetical protein
MTNFAFGHNNIISILGLKKILGKTLVRIMMGIMVGVMVIVLDAGLAK